MVFPASRGRERKVTKASPNFPALYFEANMIMFSETSNGSNGRMAGNFETIHEFSARAHFPGYAVEDALNCSL
jgi:hypothetical protein